MATRLLRWKTKSWTKTKPPPWSQATTRKGFSWSKQTTAPPWSQATTRKGFNWSKQTTSQATTRKGFNCRMLSNFRSFC
jgi:hypothetical protein